MSRDHLCAETNFDHMGAILYDIFNERAAARHHAQLIKYLFTS
jgi:hypothetical protein